MQVEATTKFQKKIEGP